ncbi:MAG: hypothetical protein M1823_003791 [Watsoniomyces obsoletus]|nr:MAG: hypothetical protein M1823_003791 [Watsoniomyces obsoletus]
MSSSMSIEAVQEFLSLGERGATWEGLRKDVHTLLDVLDADSPEQYGEVAWDIDVLQTVWRHPALDWKRADVSRLFPGGAVANALNALCVDVAAERRAAFEPIVLESGGSGSGMPTQRRDWLRDLVSSAARPGRVGNSIFWEPLLPLDDHEEADDNPFRLGARSPEPSDDGSDAAPRIDPARGVQLSLQAR